MHLGWNAVCLLISCGRAACHACHAAPRPAPGAPAATVLRLAQPRSPWPAPPAVRGGDAGAQDGAGAAGGQPGGVSGGGGRSRGGLLVGAAPHAGRRVARWAASLLGCAGRELCWCGLCVGAMPGWTVAMLRSPGAGVHSWVNPQAGHRTARRQLHGTDLAEHRFPAGVRPMRRSLQGAVRACRCWAATQPPCKIRPDPPHVLLLQAV